MLFQEFEPWNLGQEPSISDKKGGVQHKTQADPRSAKTVTPPRKQSYTPTDVMITDEPFTIDTSNYTTSRVVISPPNPAEPEYTLEKKGHTSVIRVSYPLPSEPSVTFPTLPPSAAQDTPPIPPARRNAGNVPAAAAAGATAMPPQLAKFPTLQIRSDSQMGLDNFKFCTVLGRGHFGKVRGVKTPNALMFDSRLRY